MFSTLATREYGIYVASSDFDPNDPPKENLAYPNCFDEHAAENMSDFYSNIRTFDKLPISKCQDAYAVDFNTNRGTVILVTNNPRAGNTSLLYTGTGNWPDRVGNPKNLGYSWMCNGSDCSRKMLEEDTKSAHGKWSISAVVCPMPVISATVFSETTYTLNSTTLKDVPDIQVSSDELGDIRRLKRRMWEQPPYEELHRFLHDPRGWKNSSWAEAIKIHELDNPCPSYSLSGSSLDSSAGSTPSWPMQLDYSPTSRVVETTVRHCLSEKVNEKCQLLFSLPLCLAVILCNSIKVLAIFLTAHGSRREVLLTVGDAMSSFLSNPDKTTEGNCLLSKSSIKASESWKPSSVNAHILQKGRQVTLSKRQRWVYSVSRRDWILTIAVLVLHNSLGQDRYTHFDFLQNYTCFLAFWLPSFFGYYWFK